MSFISLITHGLSAIAVYGDIVRIRLLLATLICNVFILACMGAVEAIKLSTDLTISTWATFFGSVLYRLVSQAFVMMLVFVFITLQGRAGAKFLPISDFQYFILEVYDVQLDG